ncbi:MAG: ferrous iron transport protein A [Deltaproteobacteria bacterium]|nr:ferrous iron transport protein A [Deltaproteobacteria bacterium]
MSKIVSLNEIPINTSGKIVEINGGRRLFAKLEAMGIKIGDVITKTSAQWMKGPVIIRKGNTDVAIGYGMAGKIMVETSGKGRLTG